MSVHQFRPRSIAARETQLRAARGEHRPRPAVSPMAPYSVITPERLQGVAIPPRDWIVSDWLPVGHVTLLYGDGGTGKSLLAQQLMTACATGRQWLGMDVARCVSFGLFSEDECDELHRRQASINGALGIDFSDLGGMRYVSGVGRSNLLSAPAARGVMAPTPRWVEVEAAVVACGARFVVLDTAAATFGGDEIKRAEVTQFVSMLDGLAHRIKGAVVLTAHPSRAGMSGDMDGGSTAWNGSARSRLALVRPDGKDGTPDPDARVLSRRKANYARRGDAIDMRWHDGAFHAGNGVNLGPVLGQLGVPTREQQANATFLRMFDEHTAAAPDVKLSPSGKSPFAAARVLHEMSGVAGGFTRRELDAAMLRLIRAGTLQTVGVGRQRDGRLVLERATAVGEGEPEPANYD